MFKYLRSIVQARRPAIAPLDDSSSSDTVCLVSNSPFFIWAFYRSLPTKLQSLGFGVHVVTEEGPEVELIRDKGVTVWTTRITRSISPIVDLRSLLQLVRIFRKEKFSIVHAHTPKGGLLGMVAAMLAGVNGRLYTCHGLPAESESRPFVRFLLGLTETVACTCAREVFCVSESLETKLRKSLLWGGGSSKIKYLGSACGVDLKRFTKTENSLAKSAKIREDLGIPSADVVIGFVGRMLLYKGLGLVLETFLKLVNRHPNLTLLAITKPDPERGLLSEEQLRLLNTHPKIKHIHYVNDVEYYYPIMDLIELPSEREGLPMVLLEGAAMELPIVTTKATGCVDAVIHGQTGLLIPLNDESALYNALDTLVSDKCLREKMGKAGRLRIERKFNEEVLLDEHVSLYRRYL